MKALLAFIRRIIQPYSMYIHNSTDRNLPTHDVRVGPGQCFVIVNFINCIHFNAISLNF